MQFKNEALIVWWEIVDVETIAVFLLWLSGNHSSSCAIRCCAWCGDVRVLVVIEQDTTVFSLTLIISVARGQAAENMFLLWDVCSVKCAWLEVVRCVYVHPQILSVTGLSWWWTKRFQWFISAEHHTSIRLHYAHAEPTVTDNQKKLKTVFIRSISLVCFSSTSVTKVTFMHYCNIQSGSCYCVTLSGMSRCYFCIMWLKHQKCFFSLLCLYSVYTVYGYCLYV